jgi:iron(III) transport system substrate-binding protein
MRGAIGLLLGLALLAAACGEAAPGPATTDAEPAGAAAEPTTLRLYTTVTQDTVDAVLAAFGAAREGVEVEVFRAPTGGFNARVAAERREGRIRADLFWLTDPLSMLQYDADGLLAAWTPAGAEAIDERLRTDTFWGTRLLNLVIVAHADVADPPASWHDLPDVEGGVALPDPGFAGSAFAALAYFALDEEFGMDYYQRLADAGAVQVDAPGEVVSAVAEGRVQAGMTLDKVARDARDEGSPLQLVWPEPGAIVVDSPIAVLADSAERDAAERFVQFVLSVEGQRAVAATGWQPVRDDVPWEHPAPAAVHPDWEEAFARQEELLGRYRAIFGG